MIDFVMLFIAFILWRNRNIANKVYHKIINFKVLQVTGACLIILTTIITLLPAYVFAADLQQNSNQHPLMHPTQEQLKQWEADYVDAAAPPVSRALVEGETAIPTSYSLLSDISYVPADRNQGQAGNCWVWAGTGLMEASLDVDKALQDRLSVQYLDSNYNSGTAGNWAGCGGDLSTFASFYQSKQITIPWSNTKANYQDGNQTCSDGTSVKASSIGLTPYYPVSSSIAAASIPTTGVDNTTAIANIKSYLLQNKAVYFGFYLSQCGLERFR